MVTVLFVEHQRLKDLEKLGHDLIAEVPSWRIGRFVLDPNQPEYVPYPMMPDWLEKVLRSLKLRQPLFCRATGKQLRFEIGKLTLYFSLKDPQQYRTDTRIYLLETKNALIDIGKEHRIRIKEEVPVLR